MLLLSLALSAIETFELLNITLPARFQEARTRQETARRAASRAENDLNVAEIDARTQVVTAEREAEVIVLEARQAAQQVRFENAAAIVAVTARRNAEADAYNRLKEQLGLSEAELLTYVWIDAIREAQSKPGGAPILNVQLPGELQGHVG